MAPDLHKNFAVSTVATAPSPATSGTSLVVAAGQGALFPTPPFNAVIWPAASQPVSTNAEVVRVTGISTDTFTITRTQESSSARTVVVGDQIDAAITNKTLTDAEAAGGAMTQISASTLVAPAASFDFTGIAGTYNALKLFLICRGDTAAATASVLMRFNGDTGSNYQYQHSRASSTANDAVQGLSQTAATVTIMPAATSGAGLSAVQELAIPGYANTSLHKAAVGSGSFRFSSSLFVITTASQWLSTSAITQVTLLPSAGNFDTGSQCALYGIT